MTDPIESDTPASFEGALEELQSIVHELEEGNLGLESSLKEFERGVGLLRNCYQLLEQAEQRIEILTGTDTEGNPVLEPFDASATHENNSREPKKPGRRRSAPRSNAEGIPPASDVPRADEQRLF